MLERAFAGSPIMCRAEGGCGHDDAEHYESWRGENVRSIACRACDRNRGRCREHDARLREAANRGVVR